MELFRYHNSFLFNHIKKPVVFTSDLLLTLFAIWCTQWITSEITHQPPVPFLNITLAKFSVLCTFASSYWLFGLYRGVWRYASIPDFIRIIKACVTGTFILALVNMYIRPHLLPDLLLPLYCLLLISLLSGSRLTYRMYRDSNFFRRGKKVLVIGAGTAGESIIRSLKRNKTANDLYPVGLVDDNPGKHGLELQGVRVLGTIDELEKIVKKTRAELILIAIPEASPSQMRRIVSLCEQTHIPYRTLPTLNDIASGKAILTNIRQVSVEDLLDREPIQFNKEKLFRYIGGKKILVTGAGGSIGSELCRRLAECEPDCLILVEHSEFNLFQIQTELEEQFPALKLYKCLISVTNQEMVHQVMQQHKPDYVFHAAAYKHVPLLESQVRIAIDNNIFGTQMMANAAHENHVKKFILISTDKAVNPNNVMGATKRCAEIFCQCLNKISETDFIAVRFGNVLGSTGSVVPLFKQQIAKGGPITITHPDMERYFMTIQEAVQLVIETVTITNPSDMYVLDMGEPIKIQYLAEQMIKFSGHRPNVDIHITYRGLRPGEKVNEELFYNNEKVLCSDHEKIMRVEAPSIDSDNYMRHLVQLKEAFVARDENLRKYLFELAAAKNLDDLSLQAAHKFALKTKKISPPLAVEYFN